MTEPTMKNDLNRATGRTTGLMLQALGKAIENPGKEVEFIDHHEQNFAQLQYCKERIEKIAKQLNLDVSVNNWSRVDTNNMATFGLYVKSNWISPYSQRTPVEEAFKDWMGVYPPTNPSVDNIFDIRWRAFQMGYNAAYEEKVVEEPEENEWKLVALRLGEKLSDNGPGGYYDFTPGEWLEWALNECEREMIKRNLKTSLREMVNGDVQPNETTT